MFTGWIKTGCRCTSCDGNVVRVPFLLMDTWRHVTENETACRAETETNRCRSARCVFCLQSRRGRSHPRCFSDDTVTKLCCCSLWREPAYVPQSVTRYHPTTSPRLTEVRMMLNWFCHYRYCINVLFWFCDEINVLPHKWMRRALTPTSKVSWYSIYGPRKDGRLSWPRLPGTLDHKFDALTITPPSHPVAYTLAVGPANNRVWNANAVTRDGAVRCACTSIKWWLQQQHLRPDDQSSVVTITPAAEADEVGGMRMGSVLLPAKISPGRNTKQQVDRQTSAYCKRQSNVAVLQPSRYYVVPTCSFNPAAGPTGCGEKSTETKTAMTPK